ncbi:glutamyl-tRNA reductase [Oceanicoccus sagamiensis]|uniref:Glutamyl-tRNA reductase n=1 Tax=Oceanicoccus sagamiensis TaxID=716816 RepID=A0A1X9NBX1_9GAMM|nr:glutamyl-tRNA reductase [Oceanicoccus sagamiensis]ARN74671.1 glutamyl-tRNA reductase [Oceanicoccus sagamiensis]
MGLIALGINHKSANVALRERVAFAPEQMAEALQDALSDALLAEAVILSTCNRTELFAIVADEHLDGGEQRALAWLGAYHHIPLADLESCYYSYSDQQALRHIIQVTSGLDSMVLGEPQIFGQMKSAFAVAQEASSVGSELSRIFPHVFSVAKKVRTDTAIGKNPVSVAYAAVNVSHHIFSDLSETRALLIGAGETIELVARHLSEKGVKSIVVANRTLGRARELAHRFGAEAVLLSEIPEQLVQADIVISSTASQLPILGKGAVEHALKLRKHRPILMVDIAVPRDIEEQVGELSDIYLYTVDDLTEIVDENKRNRESEARKADKLIDKGVENYLQQLRSLDVVSTLKAYRQQSEQTRDIELEKALKQLAKGESAERVVTQLARSLTNKFMHKPSIEMKKASAEGHEDRVSWAHQLFGLQVDQEPEEKD